MLRLFKQGTLGQVIVIIAAALLLWWRAFVWPVEVKGVDFFSPLYELLCGWTMAAPRLASAVALLLILGEGAWLNLMLTNHKMTRINSLMPMLLYLVAMSWNSELLTLTPLILVNAMVLLACSQLLSDGSTSLSVDRNFNASFFIGLMALCYLPALWYIVPFLFVFVVYKLYRWRDVVVSVFGLIAPSVILFTYAFLSDRLDYYLILIWHDIVAMNPHWVTLPFWKMLPTLLFVLLLTAALMKQLGTLNEGTVHHRINTGVLTLPLTAWVVMLMYSEWFPLDTQSVAVPFSFLVTFFLMTERKREWIGEVMIWLLLVCCCINVLLF